MRPFRGARPRRHKLKTTETASTPIASSPSVLVVIEGDLIDTLCAEPAVAALGEMPDAPQLTIGGAFADVFAGHPNIRGLWFPDADTQPEGFDRILNVSALSASAMPRIVHAAECLAVTPSRQRPRMVLTGLDTLRAGRLELERLGRPIALCLTEAACTVPALRQRWQTVCRLLCQRPNTAVVLLCGTEQSLPVQKDVAGRLTVREIAAAIARCAAWVGDDPVCAALAGAVDAPGLFVSDSPIFDDVFAMGRCEASASAERIATILDEQMAQIN